MKTIGDVKNKVIPLFEKGDYKAAYRLIYEWVKTSKINLSTFIEVVEWLET